MRHNRFLTFPSNQTDVLKTSPVSNRFRLPKPNKNGFGRAATITNSNTPNCVQVGEDLIDGDLFILDVLELFFGERLTSVSLNDALRQTAAYAADQANQSLSTYDAMPRPANGSATATWLISDAVQIAFRKAQNKCLILPIIKIISQRLRVQYERDKNAAKPLSSSNSYYSNTFGVNNLTISQSGIDLIKRFEGFRANLYNDVAGHCTIGYGTLVHQGNCNGSESAEFRSGITETRATDLLMARINSAASTVNERVNVVLNQNQFDALVSFVYNIGVGAFGRSTLLRRLNEGSYADVPSELRRWVKVNGVTTQGLVNRRNAEIEVFNRAVSTSQSYGSSLTKRGCGCHDTNSPHSSAASYGARMLNAPRGIRNNNPGNIEMNDANQWEGKVPRNQNTDGRFEQFTSYAYGVRALIMLLRTYIRGSRNTVTRIFEAYAPPSENNTQNYIRFVSDRIGIGPNDMVPLTRTNLKALAQAIARMENGQEAITDTQYDEGWSLLAPEVSTSISQSWYSNAYQENPFFDVRTCTPDTAFNTTWTNIKSQIVATARAEFAFWTKPNGSRYTETEAFVTQRLKDYWAVVGVHPTTAQIQSNSWQNGTPPNYSDGHPWSAAFISYLMHQAGATPSFAAGQRHTIYAFAGKQNADSRNFDNPFWLCRVNDALPEPGDLIVKNRSVNGTMGTITYDTLTSSGSSHSDVVTEIDYAHNRLTVMGGNVGQTVNTSTYTLNADGTINTTAHPEVFAILKLRTDKCETCGTVAIV